MNRADIKKKCSVKKCDSIKKKLKKLNEKVKKSLQDILKSHSLLLVTDVQNKGKIFLSQNLCFRCPS